MRKKRLTHYTWDGNCEVELWQDVRTPLEVAVVLVTGGKDVPKVRHILTRGRRMSLKQLEDEGLIRKEKWTGTAN